MFIVSFVVLLVALLVLPGSALSPTSESIPFSTALLASSMAAGVATLAEARSPAGTDNLSVPLLAAAALYLLVAV
jgi:phytol kinase